MQVETNNKEKILFNVLVYFLSFILIFVGIFSNKFLIVVGFGILYINLAIKNINILFSTLIVLYLFYSSYLLEQLDFKWTNLYYAIAILIIVFLTFKKMIKKKISNPFKDKYLFMMVFIVTWGILSAFFSTQIIQSFKNILSIFLVFVLFYIIPVYFYNDEEKRSFMFYLVIPINIWMTVLSLLNLLFFLELIDLNKQMSYWTINASIYQNSNTFGINILMALIIMNLYILIDEKFKYNLGKNKTLKIYILFSYMVLIINLILSGSRSAILGAIIVFIPFMYKKKKETIFALILIGCSFLGNGKDLLLFKKLSQGTLSGRGEMWIYSIQEVIAKYPILGIGSGASNDYMGIFGGLSVHNSYLNIIMTNGFIGFMLWIFVLMLIFYKSFKTEDKYKYIFIFTILGFMAFAFFETGLFGGMGLNMSIFWTFVMLIENQLNMEEPS